MLRRFTVLTIVLFAISYLNAQNIPNSRKVDWSICGYEGEIPCGSVIRNAVTEFGVDATGATDVTTQINNALININAGEVLYFPAGTYLFNDKVNVPANRIIRGESPTTTIFNFDFVTDNTCLSVIGSGNEGTEKSVVAVGNFGDFQLTVSNTSGLSVGDEIELEQENDPAIHGAEDPSDLTSWAAGLKGQLARISAINGNIITLDRSLVFQYDLNFAMVLRKLNLTEEVGIENLKIFRQSDNGTGASNNNILFSYAKNCWVRRVHIEYSSRYHVRIDRSRNIEMNESFLDKAYDCGGGGAGYGILVQDHASECLFENNIARALRHPWIPKEGAARNVYAYNYSSGTTQGTACDSDPLTNSLADISLHGHYPAYNLFEGNIVYRITSSDAWGPNGPGNTFFRNRVLGSKGIWIQSYSKEQNVIANELTHPSAQFEMNRDGTVTGTTLNYSNVTSSGLLDLPAPQTLLSSYYLSSKPAFFGSIAWPNIGPDVTFNTGQIPAEIRFNSGNYFNSTPLCSNCEVPDLGPNQSLCGQSSIVLNSQLTQNNRTFSWFRGTQDLLMTTPTLSITQPGVYKVFVDSAGCETEDEITITNDLGVLDLGSDQTLCNPAQIDLISNIQQLNYNYEWSKNGEVLTNETQDQLTVYRAGTYRLEVSASGCTAITDEVIISSNLLDVMDDSLCDLGTATLEVLNSGDYVWYDQPENGNELGTNTTLSTSVNSTTTFYVEDAQRSSSQVGMLAPTLTNNEAFKDDRFDRKLTFTVLAPLSLDSLSIWSNTATEVTLRILASDNSTVVFSKVFSNVQTEQENRLNVGAELPSGDYFLDFEGTNGKLYFSNENDLSISYPYEVSGIISITGASPAWVLAKPYYMFAYNWKVSTGNTCARTPVFAVLDPTQDKCVLGTFNEKELSNHVLYPNPFSDGFRMENVSDGKLIVMTLAGNIVSEESVSQHTVFGKSLEKGTYLVQLITNNETETFKIIKE